MSRLSGRGSDAGGVHAAELGLELADLVAEAGGQLELQLRGGGVHLLGQLGDQPDELAAGRAGFLGRLASGGALARLRRDRAGARGQARYRRLAAGLLAPAAADQQLLGVGVLADDLVQDVGDLLA